MISGLNMWEMTYIFGTGSSVWETAKLCGKWLRSVGNGSNMWGNDLIIWQTA